MQLNAANETLLQDMPDSDEKEDDNSEIANLKAEIERLEAENKKLKEDAAALETEKSRMDKEVAEFSEYFPEISLDEVPDEVWGKVKSGLTLTAAYAVHERKLKMQKKQVEEINTQNGAKSSGSIRNITDFYYSPSDVRKMTPSEVKRNYTNIINSMKHWN